MGKGIVLISIFDNKMCVVQEMYLVKYYLFYINDLQSPLKIEIFNFSYLNSQIYFLISHEM